MKIIDGTVEKKHSYTKRAKMYADGKSGYHEQEFEIYDNGISTGIVESAVKKGYSSRWTFSYKYKGKEYASPQEAIKVYEREHQ